MEILKIMALVNPIGTIVTALFDLQNLVVTYPFFRTVCLKPLIE